MDTREKILSRAGLHAVLKERHRDFALGAFDLLRARYVGCFTARRIHPSALDGATSPSIGALIAHVYRGMHG